MPRTTTVGQSFWQQYWRCIKCKFAVSFKKVKVNDIKLNAQGNPNLHCKKCGDIMKRTGLHNAND